MYRNITFRIVLVHRVKAEKLPILCIHLAGETVPI